jgi:hypothetical protein
MRTRFSSNVSGMKPSVPEPARHPPPGAASDRGAAELYALARAQRRTLPIGMIVRLGPAVGTGPPSDALRLSPLGQAPEQSFAQPHCRRGRRNATATRTPIGYNVSPSRRRPTGLRHTGAARHARRQDPAYASRGARSTMYLGHEPAVTPGAYVARLDTYGEEGRARASCAGCADQRRRRASARCAVREHSLAASNNAAVDRLERSVCRSAFGEAS